MPAAKPDHQTTLNAAVLSAASYKNDDGAKSFLEGGAYKDQHNIKNMSQTNDMDDGYKLSYILAEAEWQGSTVLYLAIRGTDCGENWYTNFNVSPEMKLGGRPGKVHRGFWEFAQKLPLEFLQAQVRRGKEVILTGHSLGGAAAAVGTMCLLRTIKITDKRRVRCITFGSPMFADSELARDLENRGEEEHFYHLVHEDDIVPRIFNNVNNVDESMKVLRVVPNILSTNGLVKKALNAFTMKFKPVGQFEVICAEAKNLSGHEAKDFMTQRLEFYVPESILQKHNIGTYIHSLLKGDENNGSLRLYRVWKKWTEWVLPIAAQDTVDENSDRQIGQVDTTSEIFRPSCKVAMLDSHPISLGNQVKFSLRLDIYGTGLGLLERLKMSDLFIDTQATVLIEELKMTVHSDTRMSYSVLVSCPENNDFFSPNQNPNLNISFRKRFGKSPELGGLQIQPSYYPSREEKTLNENIVETLVNVFHNLKADILYDQTSNNDHSWENSAKKVAGPYLEPIRKLDDWLNTAMNELSEKQKNLLRGIMASVISSNVSSTENSFQFNYQEIVKALNSENEEEVKKICMEQRGPLAENADDFFSSDNEALSTSYFRDTALGQLMRERNCQLRPKTVAEMQIIFAVAIGVAYPRLLKRLERFDLIRDMTLLVVICSGFAACAPSYATVVLTQGIVQGAKRLSPVLIQRCISILRGDPFGYALYYERSLANFFAKLLKVELEGNDLHKQELWLKDKLEKAEQIDPAIKKIGISFFSGATDLRKEFLQKNRFNVGLVGEPGAGKSTFASSDRAKVLKNAPEYAQETDAPRLISCSRNIRVTDFPGMFGTDQWEGSHVNVFNDVVHSMDAVVVFMKVTNSRSYNGVKKLIQMIDHQCPVYVCMTHFDDQILKDMKGFRQQDGERLANHYDKAIENLGVVLDRICDDNGLRRNDVHFTFPSKFDENEAKTELPEMDVSDGTGDDTCNSTNHLTFNSTNHLVKWLHDQAKKSMPGSNNDDIEGAFMYC